MPQRNLYLSVAAIAGLALFFYTLVHLILLRYQRGDIFPPSSTLRADPLGARAFYEALPDAGNYEVSRGYVSLRRELAQKPATLFVLGLDAEDFDSFTPDEIDQLDDYLEKGGRVVVTLMPVNWANNEEERESKEKKAAAKKEESKDKPSSSAMPIPEPPGQPKTQQEKYEREEYKKDQVIEQKIDPDRYVPDKFHPSLLAVWGMGWTAPGDQKGDAKNGKNSDKTADANQDGSPIEYSSKGDVLAVRTGPAPAEDKVPWKSPIFFLRLEPTWQVDYQAKGKPVLIERAWGTGKIIVASDSYLISNEALRDDREPQLLGWMAGPSGLLLFDETHLGTQEQDGVMVLARRYRLEGYLYGLLIVAGLFLWRQSVPLVPPAPPRANDPAGGAVSGKDSRGGLVNLLRRNIRPRDLLPTCLAEWRRYASFGQSAARTAEMETVIASADTAQAGRIIDAYRQLCHINTGGRPRKNYANQP
jgi:hypothetical protein